MSTGVLEATKSSHQVSEALNDAQKRLQAADYLRALSEMEGIGRVTIQRLLEAAGTLEALWEASDTFLKEHLTPRKCEAFWVRRDRGLSSDWRSVYGNTGIHIVTLMDATYPALLREIHQPPLMLFVKGNLACLDADAMGARSLAIVGTRKASEYGRLVTRNLIRECRPAFPVIVSGLADGIDTEAHRSALSQELPTVAVFGCGLDIIYPSRNRSLAENIVAQGGALVSEYELGTGPSRVTFPQRNRIVAGLSQAIVVIEGDVRSGAMITARLGLEEGRSIVAVPGSIYAPNSQGPHALLKQGAIPFSTGGELMQDLHWSAIAPPLSTAMNETGFRTQPPSFLSHPAGSDPGAANTIISAGSQRALTLQDSNAGLPSGNPVTKAGVGAKMYPRSGSTQSVSQAEQVLPDGCEITPEELALWQEITLAPIAVEALQLRMRWTAAQVAERLTMLELEDLIVQLPGAHVSRKAR